jgi:hypothetical protein
VGEVAHEESIAIGREGDVFQQAIDINAVDKKAEENCGLTETLTSGAKAPFILRAFTARLKPCP